MATLKVYSIMSDVTIGIIDPKKLSDEIETTTHVTNYTGLVITGDELKVFGDVLADGTALDNLILNHDPDLLQQAKDSKNIAIDTRTGELIDMGFNFASEVFSLSAAAQRNWIALKQADGASLLTYPLKISTNDDGEYAITDTTELGNFYAVAIGTAQTHWDSGRALKLSVNAAVDIAAVDIVVDNR